PSVLGSMWRFQSSSARPSESGSKEQSGAFLTDARWQVRSAAADSYAVCVSQPFWSRARQRNVASIHRRALPERGKLGWTEASGHGMVGGGLRNRESSRDRTCT